MKEQEVMYSKLDSSKSKPARNKCCTRRLAGFIVLITLLMFTASIFLFVGIGGVCCFPLHASCDADWTFTKACSDVQTTLISQINKWETADNCKNGGEKCLYKLVSHTATELKATHQTPKKGYIDDMTFTFTQSGDTCQVKGTSSSQTWYAVLDMGTNYCNMHNLVTGAGLDKTAGYSETANDKTCTQYSSADCEVY